MRILFPFGLNENEQPDLLEAYAGSKNFELSKSSTAFTPRKSFDLADTATNAGDIRGIMQLVTRAGTETTLIQAGALVYTWDGTNFNEVHTVSATSKLRDIFWALDDILIISDVEKETVLKTWNGTAMANLTTGLASALYAKYAVVHQNRVWLFNITEGTTDLPHVILASAFENQESYDTTNRAGDSGFVTGNEAFYLIAPDLKPINGVAVFHDQLVFSTVEGRLFALTGSDATDYAIREFFAGSAAIGDESIVNIGNDVAYMRAGGNIESLLATDQFGDVATDDLSRWIPDTVENLTGCLAVYDQSNQKVLFFVSNKVLVFFKDIVITGKSPWSVYETTHPSLFNTNAAKYMRRPGTSNFTVYFGDDSGRIFDLYGTGQGDAGSYSIVADRKTKFIDREMAQIDFRRQILTGRIHYRRIKPVEAQLTFEWGDDYSSPTCVISLKGVPDDDTGAYYGGDVYYSGDFYYNEGFAFSRKKTSRGFSPTGKGPGFFLTVRVDSTDDFQIDEITIPDQT